MVYYPIDTSRSRGIVALCVLTPVFSTAAVVGRFASRRIQRAELRLDDYFILPSLLLAYTLAAIGFVFILKGGYGHHLGGVQELAQSDFSVVKLDAILAGSANFVQYISMACARTSLLLLLRRIFHTKKFRVAVYALLAFNTLWLIYAIIVVAIACVPWSKSWDRSEKGFCIDQYWALQAVAIWEIVLDLSMWVLPIPMVWQVNLTTRQKISLTAVFGIGAFDIFTSVMRVVSITQLNVVTDYTYTISYVFTWCLLDAGVGVVCACAPVLKPVLTRMMAKLPRLNSGQEPSTMRRCIDFVNHRVLRRGGNWRQSTVRLTSVSTASSNGSPAPPLDEVNNKIEAQDSPDQRGMDIVVQQEINVVTSEPIDPDAITSEKAV